MKNTDRTNRWRRLSDLGSKLLLEVVAICVVTLSLAATASADNRFGRPIVITESGFVAGVTTNGVNEFLGIPYAKPPVGALRWTPPIPYGFFPGFFLEATKFGSECTQSGSLGSENCLFLNVYSPGNHQLIHSRDDRGRRLPVMVWIHGGALTSGAGSDYDPSLLVKQGVIVVTLNYRLGLLGFFAQSALDSESHEAGNYGLMDQQFALEWVHKNIARFGGDPNRVTMFGESAGGQSVYANLASPTAAKLFRGAISESGSYVEFQDYFDYIVTLAVAETTGTAGVPSGSAIAASVGCGSQTALCLRAVPASKLVAAQAPTLYPFVDGTLLSQTPQAAFASGQFNQVPVISGTNHDEWRVFVAEEYDLAGHPILTSAQYAAAVAALWGPLSAPVLSLYPFDSYPSGGVALGTSGTDGIFSCPARNADQLLSKFVSTFTYEFNDENAPPAQSSVPGLTFPLGAYHSAELQYLFIVRGVPAPFTAQQQQLSAAMISYWTNFAKTGDPNSPGQPLWSAYSASTDEFQSLIPPTPTVETTFAADHMCTSFWDTF
ncbi:MAG: carboxylesterase/lipase family protein [Candidatus Binataceae bacterium]